MPQPLPIQAVNHVGRMTKRVDASRDFYRDVLGFREVARPNFIQTRHDHLALHCEDLELAERLLKEHGVAYRKNVIEDRGITQIFCRDPDGHHVEIGTYPPTPPFV